MSKHDTWIKLKPNSPYQNIEHLFPTGFPMRDPFPLEFGKTSDGENVSLWIIDAHRLNDEEKEALAVTIANSCGVSSGLVLEEALKNGGFSMKHGWVASMCGGAENYRRTIEFLDFDAQHPSGIDHKAWQSFYQQQYADWIEGDREPEPMPESYENIDPRLKTPELEEAYKQIEIHKFLGDGNYSVFDILSGRAMANVINQIDPENDWELVTD